MKSFIKYTGLFIFLSVVFSNLTACQTTVKNLANQNVSVADSNSTEDVKTSDFPPVSPASMQAELTGTDGKKFKLEDYKGKVILVNFWATWCGPCRKEMPEFVKLQSENKEKGFEVIGVDADAEENAEMIKTFGENMKLNYTLAKADMEFFGEFLKVSKRDSIPQTFLIDRNGKLRGVFLSADADTVAQLKENVGKVLAAN